MMNRLGPPVSGGVQVGILARLGPAVGSAQGGNTPKKKPVVNAAAASKTNKAGQVFYNNQKVFFNDGEVFDASGTLLSTGGTVKFQNGRLEYVGGTHKKGILSPKARGTASVLSRLAPAPAAAPAKTPAAAPAKTPIAAPAKAPVAAPAKAPVAAPAKTPITGPDAEAKKVATSKKAPAKSPIKAPARTPITAPEPDTDDKKPVPPKKAPIKAPVKTPITAPAAEPKKVAPPKVLGKKGGVVSRLGPPLSNGVAADPVNNKRKPDEETKPAKRAKEMKEVPKMKDIIVKSILNVSPNRNTIDVVCVVPGGDNAIIKLEKAPFGSEVNEIQEYLKSSSQKVLWKKNNMANITLSSTGTFDNLHAVNAELTYPASDNRILNLKKSCPPRILRETPEFYRDRVMPYIRKWLPANQPNNWKWIDDILSGTVAPERLVGSHKPVDRPENGYTLVKDVKWAHSGLENVLEDMHILGIVHRKDIFCIRDLTAEHLPLLKGLYLGGTAMIRSKFGIQVEDQVVFLLYYPNTYHLHVNFTTWGKYEQLGRLGEAHLLVDVISNLEDVDPNYYRKVTLNVVVNKSYEFLYSTQEGTMPPPLGESKPQDMVDRPNNGMPRAPPQPVYRDPHDPFWQLQAALMNILGRFQEVLHGNLEFLRLPIKELMKHILNQPRDLMDRIAIPLKELLHHLENRPLDHMPQLEGVLAELLQFFQKHPLERMMDPTQNQIKPLQTSDDYLRGYQMPRYHM